MEARSMEAEAWRLRRSLIDAVSGRYGIRGVISLLMAVSIAETGGPDWAKVAAHAVRRPLDARRAGELETQAKHLREEASRC